MTARAQAAGAGEPVIKVEGLTKRYGELVAVDGLSLAVERGEIFGILGPNGAGKTTTLEMVEGLRKPDGGTVSVDGLSVWPDPRAVKRRIGVQLQATALFDYQRLYEMIYVFGSCYGIHRGREACTALLERVGRATVRRLRQRALWRSGAATLDRLALVATRSRPSSTSRRPASTRAPGGALGRDRRDQPRRHDARPHHALHGRSRAVCDRVAVMDRGRMMALDVPRA